MASIGELFGFSKSKRQGDYGGQQPMRYYGSPYEQITRPAIQDFLARKGTGYTPDLISAGSSLAVREGQMMGDKLRTAIAGRATAGGLGRSSLANAQQQQAATETQLGTQRQIQDLQERSQQQEIASQRQGLGAGLTAGQMDLSSQQAIANQQYQEFLRQQQYREAADQAQKEGIMRSIMTGASAIAGGAGLLPGVPGITGASGASGLPGIMSAIGATGGGILQGGLAGLSGDPTMFREPSSLAEQLAGISPTQPGQVDIGQSQNSILEKMATEYGMTVEQLKKILGE